MKKYNFEVGKTVYLTLGVNRARYDKSPYVEGTVTKMGRKYVTVKVGTYEEFQFDLTDELNQKTEYSQDYYLYETLEEILEQQERDNIVSKLSTIFSHYGSGKNLPIEKLRKMKEILESE